jgi:hypothetical protein
MTSPHSLLHQTFINSNSSSSSGLSEHEYISKLIEAVAKRPVLYNVELVDYKNKNKKGEGFKEVQNEMRESGANETQVQAIYKKWISIKRKFRVEYLRTKADQDNGRIPSTTYPYYESLKFLIPYCEFYKVCSQAQKRRATFFEGEDSEEERCIQEDDDFPTLTPQTTLDFLISQQKRIKLENQVNELAAAAVAMAAASSNNNANPSSVDSENNDENQQHQLFISSNSTTSSSTSTTPTKRLSSTAILSGLSSATNGRKDCSNESTSSTEHLPASSSPTISPNANITLLSAASSSSSSTSSASPSDESTNSLFGQLIARELDKMPNGMHNLMRAQILFLIAQTSHNIQMGTSNAERIMSNFNCFN